MQPIHATVHGFECCDFSELRNSKWTKQLHFYSFFLHCLADLRIILDKDKDKDANIKFSLFTHMDICQCHILHFSKPSKVTDSSLSEADTLTPSLPAARPLQEIPMSRQQQLSFGSWHSSVAYTLTLHGLCDCSSACLGACYLPLSHVL